MIEIMVVLFIVMILSLVSMPAYDAYVTSVYRDGARQSLMELASNMQKVKYRYFTYSRGALGTAPHPSIYPEYFVYNSQNIYQLRVNTATTSEFEIEAVPIHTRVLNDGNLRVQYESENIIRTWDKGNNGNFSEVW